MLVNNKSKYFPIGFVDDDLSKKGMSIHGIKVLGTRHDIPTLLKTNAVDEVLIAIPSFRSEDIRAVMEIIRRARAARPKSRSCLGFLTSSTGMSPSPISRKSASRIF